MIAPSATSRAARALFWFGNRDDVVGRKNGVSTRGVGRGVVRDRRQSAPRPGTYPQWVQDPGKSVLWNSSAQRGQLFAGADVVAVITRSEPLEAYKLSYYIVQII